MKITIDPELRTPVHTQIVNEVKRLVASGTIQPGAPMPSVRELSRTLGVEPATVARAYCDLARERLLRAGAGGGVIGTTAGRLPRTASRIRIARALDTFFDQIAVCDLDDEEINAAFQSRLEDFRSGRKPRPKPVPSRPPARRRGASEKGRPIQ